MRTSTLIKADKIWYKPDGGSKVRVLNELWTTSDGYCRIHFSKQSESLRRFLWHHKEGIVLILKDGKYSSIRVRLRELDWNYLGYGDIFGKGYFV